MAIKEKARVRLTHTSEGHNKFYTIIIVEDLPDINQFIQISRFRVQTVYGSLAKEPQAQPSQLSHNKGTYQTLLEAERKANLIIKDKIRKGYIRTDITPNLSKKEPSNRFEGLLDDE